MKKYFYTIMFIIILVFCGRLQAQVDSLQNVCEAPQFEVMTNGTDAIFFWEGAPTDTFLIIYRLESGSAQDNVYEMVNGDEAVISGLLPMTGYIAWMAKICDGDTSDIDSAVNFTTGCGTYVAPFEEHFGSWQHCWTLDPSFTLGIGCIYTANCDSSSDTANSFVDTSRAVSPVIDVSALSNPYLKFSRIQNVSDGVRKDLDLYYRDYEEDEWHYLGTFISPTASNEWKTDSLLIPSHSATLQLGFFSIQHENQPLARVSLADVYVYDGTDCPPVADLALSGISADTAFIHWIGSDSANYQVRYKMLPDSEWTSTGWVSMDGMNGQAQITPIAPLTSYEIQVASVCIQEEWVSCIFTTGCVAYVAPFEEHFDSTQHCWTLDPAFSLIANSIYTNNYVSYGYVDTVRAISPVIDVSGLSNPYLKFSRIQNEAGGVHKDLDLYYREYEDDEWHYLGTFITTTSSDEWKTDSLAIPSHSTSLQIGFFSIQHENQPFPRISLDDIYVYDGTDCPPVSDLALSGINDETAFIHWISGDTTSYQVRYRMLPDTNWTYVGDMNGQAEIAPIAILAQYEVQVAASCDTNQWISYTFQTGCNTYIAPFEEHFSSSQHCWTLDLAYTEGLDYIYTSNYVSPTQSVSFGYVDTAKAISPVIDVSGLDNPYLKFSRIQSEYNGARKDLGIYYRDYEEDEWQYIGTFITPTSSSEWKTDSVAIPSTSATLQLGFFSIQHENQQLSRISLDDIYVYNGTDCPPAADLALMDIESDSAFIHWIYDNTTAYQVRYRALPDTEWTYTADLGGLALITPISSLTTYEVQVSPYCDLEQWVSCTFTSPGGTAGLPYSTNFADTADRGWQLDNGTCLNHWTIGSPVLEDGTSPMANALFVTQNGTTAGYGLDNYYTTIVASKAFSMSDISTVNIEFDLLCGGSVQNYKAKDFLKVFFAPASVEYFASESIVPYANDTAKTYAVNFHDYLTQTAVQNYDYKINLTQGNILHINVEMPNPTPNGESQLVFVWRNDYSTYSDVQPAALITNVHVWQPTCDVVSQLEVVDIVGSHATVTWTPPAVAESFVVEYKPQGDDWTSASVITQTIDTNFLILNGLLADTVYDVRVRVNCGNILGTGNWRYTSFNTACAIVVTDSTPYVETFTTNPECWNLSVNPNHSWTFYSSNGYVRHQSHYGSPIGDPCPIYSPMMDISAVTHPFLKFLHQQPGDINFHKFDYLQIDYRTSTQSPWQTLMVCNTEISSMRWDSIPLPDTINYIQFAFIALYQEGTNIAIDDVIVYDGPSCAPLTNVSVVDVTGSAAAISWEGNSENGYVVRYRNIADTVWTYATTPDTMFIISNLQGSATYVVQVSNDCLEPNWFPVQFSTPLSAVNLPYFTDFSPGSDHGWLLNNGECTNYWTMGEVDSTNQVYGMFITENGSTPGYNISTVSVVTAEKLFDATGMDSILVEFDVRIGGEDRYDYLKLFIAPWTMEYPASSTADYNNPDYAKYNYTTYAFNFTPYFSYSSATSHMAPYTFAESIGTGFVHIAVKVKSPVYNYVNNQRVKVVFLWKNDNLYGEQPGAIITNVSVRNPTCAPVSQLVVDSVLSTTAEVSWTAGGGESDWVLEYKESSAMIWNQVPVSGTPAYSLAGLTPSTTYEVRVKADCGNDQSMPEGISFTTTACDLFCPYTFIMYDSRGDGWEGNAAVHVIQQGTDIASLVATNHHLQNTPTYDTLQLDLCHNEDITLQWTWGIWWMENGVTVLDPNGNMVYTVSGMWNHDSTLTTFTTNCPFMAPVVVTDNATDITQSEAVLHGHIADAGELPITSRGFEWKPLYAADYTVVPVTGDSMSHSLSGLSPNTDYVYRAFATTDLATIYGDDIMFTTLNGQQGSCLAPTDLHVTDSSENTLSIAWTEIGDAEQWRIQYRSVATGVMSSGISNTTAYVIADLQPNTEYQIQVQSICGTQNSDWSSVVTAQTTTGLPDYDQAFIIYPNPAKNVVIIQYVVNNEYFSGGIQVCDVYGKTVVETFHETSLPETHIDVSGLAAGLYFVRFATDRGVVTKPFVKR